MPLLDNQPRSQVCSSWVAEQQRLLGFVTPSLKGSDWLQLSQRHIALMQTPESVQLHIQTVAISTLKATDADQRLTTLPAASADTIISDLPLQKNNAEALRCEYEHLLRAGGQLILCGAGSLRGKLAADIPTDTLSLTDILVLFTNSPLRPKACYHHGSQSRAEWRQQLQYWQRQLEQQVLQKLPWVFAILAQQAAIRPGWVLLLEDGRARPNSLGKAAYQRPIRLKPATSAAATSHCRRRTISD
jgi:hypothetical protein